jgi:hypothetical protein
MNLRVLVMRQGAAGPDYGLMVGIEEVGLVIVIWGVASLLFRDWVVRLDLTLKERVTGDYFTEQVIEEQRTLLEKSARIVLAVGLLIFAAGVTLHVLHLG